MDIPKDEEKPLKKIQFVEERDGVSFWEDEEGITYVQFEDTQP